MAIKWNSPEANPLHSAPPLSEPVKPTPAKDPWLEGIEKATEAKFGNASAMPPLVPVDGAGFSQPFPVEMTAEDTEALKKTLNLAMGETQAIGEVSSNVLGVEAVPSEEIPIAGAAKALIDLVGTLQDKVEEIEKTNPEFKKLAEAQKKLKAAAQTMAPLNMGMVVMGQTHRITLKPAATKRSVKNLAAIKAILGEKVFMELASVALSDIDKYLTPEQQDEVLKYDLAETRTYKVDRIP
jgi:hypothetical protein